MSWYHDFDFGNGLRARTSHENPDGVRAIWRFIETELDGIPFAGRSVVDVGAWDGYWSFFAERHGAASVLATDDATQRWAHESGILLAKELLASRIEVREDVPIYELASLGRTFDIVLCLGVFYHLRDPLHAFIQLRHCCHPGTIVILEGEVAWSGVTRNQVQLAHSPWQECVLSSSALETLLTLAYFRVDEQVWMHPVSDVAGADGPLHVDRSMLLCRPFEGINSAYAYRPHFGLQRFDDRFREGGVADGRWWARIAVVAIDDVVPAGGEFRATLQVTNDGDGHWRSHGRPGETPKPLLSGRSTRPRPVELDFARAFLEKHIEPGTYRNLDPVGHYCRYIEENGLAGRITLGAQLWDSAMRTQIDRDYSRGFLDRDVAPGATATVAIRMRAPIRPGVYTIGFDMVCEYVCWFASVGSRPAVSTVTVR